MSVGWSRSPVPALLLAGLAYAAAAPVTAATPKVPDVVLGPEAASTSARVEAAIAEVTVYSDRARVRRRGRATVKGGAGVIRLPDLPGGVFLDTIRVSAVGGRVLRVEATPIERERMEIEQAKKLLDDLDAVDDRLAVVDDRAAMDAWEVGAVERLRPAAPVAEEKREGRKGLTVDAPSWWKALDFLGVRANAARARLVRVEDERRQLEAERDRLRAEVAKFNQGGFSDRLVQVVVVLEAVSASHVEVELEYFVPGARWKPAYNLYFSSARGQLTMETVAVVEQASGEDWPQVALALSTATPGRGIDLPELLTWTLGERSEFVPTLRARKPPRVEPMFPMPAAGSREAEARAIVAQLIRERLARAATAPARRVPLTVTSTATGEAAREERARLQAKREVKDLVADALTSGAPAPAPPPPQEQESPLSAETGPVRMSARRALGHKSKKPNDEEGLESESERAATTTTLDWQDIVAVPRKKFDKKSSYAKTWSVPLSLVDATAARRPPTFTDPYLPAVSGGGLDYVYRAPTVATVESSGKQVRVPLASQTFKTSAFYEATPALAATAFLRARVRNDGKRPLLRGPATIFGDGEFVGIGEIKTTGPSGDIEFPLGADQDIRLVRQIVPSSKTTGIILKSQETVYEVQIQIGNYKKQAVTVEVLDQLPKTRNDEIEVKLLGTDPAPGGSPDLDGVIRWRVPVPAGETRTVKLRYQITRPKDWKLYQR
jgi:uncharacterized protein DUF4139/uncharacterized protein DUF4140